MAQSNIPARLRRGCCFPDGTQASQLAFPLLVLALTNSAALAGLVGASRLAALLRPETEGGDRAARLGLGVTKTSEASLSHCWRASGPIPLDAARAGWYTLSQEVVVLFATRRLFEAKTELRATSNRPDSMRPLPQRPADAVATASLPATGWKLLLIKRLQAPVRGCNGLTPGNGMETTEEDDEEDEE